MSTHWTGSLAMLIVMTVMLVMTVITVLSALNMFLNLFKLMFFNLVLFYKWMDQKLLSLYVKSLLSPTSLKLKKCLSYMKFACYLSFCLYALVLYLYFFNSIFVSEVFHVTQEICFWGGPTVKLSLSYSAASSVVLVVFSLLCSLTIFYFFLVLKANKLWMRFICLFICFSVFFVLTVGVKGV